MVSISLGSVLRTAAPTLDPAEFDGFEGTMQELLERLCGSDRPALRDKVFAGTAVRRYLNIYVDGRDIRFTGGLATRVGPDSRVDLIPAVAGG